MILVTQLFLSLQSRPGANLADFFRFENQREPPSLADRGSLRAGKKPDILQCQLVPFLESQVTNDTQRMDAVWDSYPPEDNLKAHSQQRRGNRPRTRVGDGSTPIPKSEWNSGFLKNEDNTRDLFSFISRQICKSDLNGTLLLSTYFDGVLTNSLYHALRSLTTCLLL